MSAFDATSLLNQLHANLASITTASMGKLTRSAYRFTLDKEPEAGPDGKYFIDIMGVLPYDRKWGTGENIAIAQVAIRVAYNRLGGDLGGGDRRVVQQHAASDSMLIADVCENPDNYNSSASGISIVVFQGFSRVQEIGKTEIWETRLDVTFRSDLHTTPVQDLMVASLVADSTTSLSALSALSLADGTGAVIVATADAAPRLFLLDRENLAGDSADGDTMLSATGVTGGLWREYAGGGGFAEDMTLALPNDADVDVDAVRIRTRLSTATSGSEVSETLFDFLAGGPATVTTGVTLRAAGVKVPAGSVGAPSIAIGPDGAGLAVESSGGLVRVVVGGRAYYCYPHVLSLDPASATNGGFWCDPSVTNALEFLTTMTGGTGVIVKGGGVRRIFANAVGMSFNDVTTPVAKGTISGATNGTLGQLQAVVKSLLTYLASRGDITDSTS